MTAIRRATFGQMPSTLPQGRTRGAAQPHAAQPYNAQPANANAGNYSQPIPADTYNDVMGSGYGGSSSYSGGAQREGEPVVGLRFASALIDTVVMFVISLITMFILLWRGVLEPTDENVGFLILGYLFFPAMLYGILMEVSPLQGTLGKVWTGTVVTDKYGERISFMRAIGRNLAKLVSGVMPFYFPYWMIFMNKNKQSLHDMMAGTLVFKRGEGPADDLGQVFD